MLVFSGHSSNCVSKGRVRPSGAERRQKIIDGLKAALLGRFAARVGPAPTAAAATFTAALGALAHARVITEMDEETTTAALLGAMLASFTPAELVFRNANSPSPRFCWASYGKAGHVDTWRTESGAGADFALVVWKDTDHARLALFQAKRTETGKGGKVTTRAQPKAGRKLVDVTREKPSSSATQAAIDASVAGRHLLDVHRRPKFDPDKHVWRQAQMAVLEKNGIALLRAIRLRKILANNPDPEVAFDFSALLRILADHKSNPPRPELLAEPPTGA